MHFDGPPCVEFAAQAAVQYYGGQGVLLLQLQAAAGVVDHRWISPALQTPGREAT